MRLYATIRKSAHRMPKLLCKGGRRNGCNRNTRKSVKGSNCRKKKRGCTAAATLLDIVSSLMNRTSRILAGGRGGHRFLAAIQIVEEQVVRVMVVDFATHHDTCVVEITQQLVRSTASYFYEPVLV